MNRTFKIVMSGYNCYDYLHRAMESVSTQRWDNFDVCMVDDASSDPRQPRAIKEFCKQHGWKYILREDNGGTLRSQHEGITKLDCGDDDVIVWVDLDDALANEYSLERLNYHYRDEPLMTYGSYASRPHSASCVQAARYPKQCEDMNDYRNIFHWGLLYNHLRTATWDVYKNLDPNVDFKINGKWMKLGSDAFQMVPMLELAGGNYKFVEEILYLYSSDNPISEWRKAPRGTDDMHLHLANNISRKNPL